eukprot:6211924-Pleurochrysis_carterae.AAC.3
MHPNQAGSRAQRGYPTARNGARHGHQATQAKTVAQHVVEVWRHFRKKPRLVAKNASMLNPAEQVVVFRVRSSATCSTL